MRAPKNAAAAGLHVTPPRRYFPQGTYLGDELQTRSLRPGAYDALQLPSRVGSRMVAPADMKREEADARAPRPQVQPVPRAAVATSAAVPAPAPPAIARRASAAPIADVEGYRPRPGSVPYRVIAALNGLPEHTYFTHAQIAEQFGLPLKQIHGTFRVPLGKGALVTARIDGDLVIALPGFNLRKRLTFRNDPVDALPAAVAEPTPPLATFGEVAAQHKRLQESEASLGMWRAYVAHLLTRREFLSQLDQLRTHAPAIDAHPFHNAA